MNLTGHHAWILLGKPTQRADDLMVDLASLGTKMLRYDFATLKVDDVREIILESTLADGERVIIITSLAATREAQNALLKLLEEPQTGTTLVWCLPSRGILLPTISSRVMFDGVPSTQEGEPLSKEELKRILDERDREAALMYLDATLSKARASNRFSLVRLLLSMRGLLLLPSPMLKPVVELTHILMASLAKEKPRVMRGTDER